MSAPISIFDSSVYPKSKLPSYSVSEGATNFILGKARTMSQTKDMKKWTKSQGSKEPILATFSPTISEQVAIYTSSGSIHLINFRANTHQVLFLNLSVTALQFTPSGKHLLMALRDGSINLVDLKGNIKNC
jgi:WD40 repeat protein